MYSHPIYGEIKYDIWSPVYVHRTIKDTGEEEFRLHPNYEIMFIDNKESPYVIRHKRKKNIINKQFGYYNLSENKKNIKYGEIHIALASAFPNETPKETVDHIDDDPNNNHITNLMWMDRSDNSRKGQEKSTRQIKNNGGRHGKFVIMKKPDQKYKNDRDKSIPIGSFRSIEKCARFIFDNIIQKDNKPKASSIASKIGKAINTPHLKAYGYYFDAFEIKIDDEEWKKHPKFTEYQVSTHGRIRNSHGIISRQEISRNGAKYKNVSVYGSRKYVHKLVWETWGGKIPDKMDIMHDDNAPTNSDGTYRNWMCDLSIGSRKDNMKSFHDNKTSACDELKIDKFKEKNPYISDLYVCRKYPDNELGNLMKNVPLGIQYTTPKNRSSKYVLSRRYSKTGHDICTNGKKNVSDEEKFLDIIKIYQENCIQEKQNKFFMEININDYKKYIPKL